MRFAGRLYRALNPVWARHPLSGEGARIHGGRFNPRGVPALYASVSVLTAIREANQVGALQPTTLVSYEADLEPVFDTRPDSALDALGINAADLAAGDWRIQMREEGKAATQRLAERLIADGYCGLLVRSFAPGATPEDLNLVLWRWGPAPPAMLMLNDTEGRLR